MRKFLLHAAACLLLACPLYANEYNITIGGGVISDSSFAVAAIVDTSLSYEGGRIGVRTENFRTIDVAGKYEFHVNRTFRPSVDVHFNYIGNDGGYILAGGSLGQEIKTASPFYLKYSIGVQAALSYSCFSSYLPFSLSPALMLRIGLDFTAFRIETYMDWMHFYEKTWQAVPLFGLEAVARISEDFSIGTDIYIKSQDYFPNNAVRLISDIAGEISLIYRGEI